jgi:Cys-rich protein (TIGR01571 family)
MQGETPKDPSLYQQHAPNDYSMQKLGPHVVLMQPSVPGSSNVDANGLVVGRWKAGIFDCCTDFVPNCLMSSCCPCVTFAQVTSRMGIFSYKRSLIMLGIMYLLTLFFIYYPTIRFVMYVVHREYLTSRDLTVFYVYFAHLAAAYFMLLMVAILLMLVRKKIRQALQIPGSTCGDCLYSFFLPNYSLAQMATQVNAYEVGQCTFGPKDTLPGYVFS